MDTTDIRCRKLKHVRFVEKERLIDYKKRDVAVLNPNWFSSVIIDGADQSRFGLPHFISKTKDNRGHCLKVWFVDILKHRKPNKRFLFEIAEEYEACANHVVEVVQRLFSKRLRPGTQPLALFIQFDSNTRENNN